MDFISLNVIEKTFPTHNTIYLTLRVPKKLRKQFKYKAGQYVAYRYKDPNGVAHNRSYSMCGPENSENISICIKKIPNGLVSNFLFDNVTIGDSLLVSLPMGDFTLAKSNEKTNAIVFISAGSGITPIKAHIDLLMEKKHQKPIYLIYANNSEKDVIFYDYFKEVEKKLHNFHLILVLKETPLTWTGEQGKLITNTLQNLFVNHNIPLKNSHFYVSGPMGIIKTTSEFLTNKNVDESFIFKEKFFIDAPEILNSDKSFNLEVLKDGQIRKIDIKGSESILAASIKAGVDINHSCRTGTCLSCICTLESGKVVVQNDGDLNDIHKNSNTILACQTFVESDIKIDLDSKIKTNFLHDRNKILVACFLIMFLSSFLLLKTENNSFVAKGDMNTNHEDITCVQCHKDAPGTARQQIQHNIKSLLSANISSVYFGKKPVGNQACISCHERPNDNHPVHRFNEPKFKDAREAIHPEKCTSCHNEHQHKRVTIKETNYCINCHKDVEIVNDPIDFKHSKLIALEMWNTCIQCHDFHGNHIMKTPKSIKDTIPISKVKDYFEGKEDPYSDIKKYIVNLDSINKTLK